jgi:23S rRNA (guanosine2251-2'-O)-methyltransferase
MELIYGINPLMEALKGETPDIQTLFIAGGREGDNIRKIRQLASAKGIPVLYRKRQELDRLVGNRFHQGVAGMRRHFRYATVQEVLAHQPKGALGDLVVLLDGITDTQNLGALIRTGHCLGVNGFIIPENRSASLTASVLKASAGAMLHTPVAMVVNLARTIDYLKEEGFWVYGADARGNSDPGIFDRVKKVALVMGSEGKGMHSLVRKKCDYLVSIPMKGKIDSLNVSVAAGIIIHNVVRLWNEKQSAERFTDQ